MFKYCLLWICAVCTLNRFMNKEEETDGKESTNAIDITEEVAKRQILFFFFFYRFNSLWLTSKQTSIIKFWIEYNSYFCGWLVKDYFKNMVKRFVFTGGRWLSISFSDTDRRVFMFSQYGGNIEPDCRPSKLPPV